MVRKRGKPFVIPPGLAKVPCEVCGKDIHYLYAPHGLPIPVDPDGEIHKGTCSDPVKLRKVKVLLIPMSGRGKQE